MVSEKERLFLRSSVIEKFAAPISFFPPVIPAIIDAALASSYFILYPYFTANKVHNSILYPVSLLL